MTTVLASYVYDALDRRIGRTEGGAATWTLYDGQSPILDFNAAGAQTARYLQAGPGVVDAVLARETASGVAWYLPDRLGTIRDLVDNSGTVIDHVDYSAYGGVENEANPAVGDRLVGFAGMERSVATGLNLAFYRVQDPTTGRWLSEDPIGFLGSNGNLYAYVSNAPSGLVDSYGLAGSEAPPAGVNQLGPDVTNWFGAVMDANASGPWPQWMNKYVWGRRWGYANYPQGLAEFKRLVEAGGPWDFKAHFHFGSDPNNGCSGKTLTLFGMPFFYDVPGNIHYGYVGSAGGLPPWLLHLGADWAQKGGKDDPRDALAIDIGIELWKKRKNGKLDMDLLKGYLISNRARLNTDCTEGAKKYTGPPFDGSRMPPPSYKLN